MPRNATSKTTSKSSTKASGTRQKSAHDALQMLHEDHQKVSKMFDQFEKMKEKEDRDEEAMQTLVTTACAELTVHAQLEEEIFYPALRDAIDDADLLDEAEVEHATVKQLITELSSMQIDDELYEAKFTVLGEYVKHHVQEEEKEIFAKAKKAEVDLMELAGEMQERKLELLTELGLNSDEETEEDEDQKPASKRKNMH